VNKKLLFSSITTVVLSYSGFGLAYTWTVINKLDKDAQIELKLETCAAHNPKAVIPAGGTQVFKVDKWYSAGCCLSGVDVNGKNAGFKWIDTADNIAFDSAGWFAGGTTALAQLIVEEGLFRCSDRTIYIVQDKKGKPYAVLPRAEKKHHDKSKK
jgi:hypothetical protein